MYKHPPAADSEKPSARLLNIWIPAETLITLKIQLRFLPLASLPEGIEQRTWRGRGLWGVGVACPNAPCVTACVLSQCVPLESLVKRVPRPACAPTTVPATQSMVPASVTRAGLGPTAPDVSHPPQHPPAPPPRRRVFKCQSLTSLNLILRH